jgi:hypothetical protein
LKSSALYDARQHATPTQLKSTDHKRNFRETIAARAADLAGRKTGPTLALAPAAQARALPAIIDAEVDIPLSEPDLGLDLPHVWVRDIQKAVSQHFNLQLAEMLSHRRPVCLTGPRQIAMYIAKVLTVRTLPEIGRLFANRDHTTILFAYRKIERLIRTDPAIAQDVGEIINNLGCRDI